MAPSAVFSRTGHFGAVEWRFDDRSLTVTAPGLPTEVYPLRAIAGIAGDDYTIHLTHAGDRLTLSRLGDAGAVLRARLLESWPKARTEALGVAGPGRPMRFDGSFAHKGGSASPCAALLYDDVLVVACEGSDAHPIYLASVARIQPGDDGHGVRLGTWEGGGGWFTDLGAATGEFLAALDANRNRLLAEAADAVAAIVPGLASAEAAALGSRWLSGEMLPLAALEAGSPGFEQAFRAGCIASGPRSAEAAALLSWGDPARVFVGYERRPLASECPVWLLAGRGTTWLLENLSETDIPTHRFSAGGEMVALASFLVKSRRFTREALYMSTAELMRDRPELVLPTNELPFLRDLRERYRGRIDHGEGWADAINSEG